MKKPLYIVILISVLFLSCKKDEDENKNRGEILLTSEFTQVGDNYLVVGFSFDEGKNIPFSITSGTLPDIVVSNETDVQGNVTGAFLNSPSNLEAFHLNQSFYTLTEAQVWFDHYNEVVATDFKPLAESIIHYQVWTIQTSDKKYAKLLIKDIQIMRDSPISDYVEIIAEYQYQPDGSKIFDHH